MRSATIKPKIVKKLSSRRVDYPPEKKKLTGIFLRLSQNKKTVIFSSVITRTDVEIGQKLIAAEYTLK